MVLLYMNLYRKCDFLCEGCVEFYYDRRRQEMLGIQKIVSIKEYNANHKPFCDKCELYEWNHTIKGSVVYSLILDYQFCACVMWVSGVPQLQVI